MTGDGDDDQGRLDDCMPWDDDEGRLTGMMIKED